MAVLQRRPPIPLHFCSYRESAVTEIQVTVDYLCPYVCESPTPARSRRPGPSWGSSHGLSGSESGRDRPGAVQRDLISLKGTVPHPPRPSWAGGRNAPRHGRHGRAAGAAARYFRRLYQALPAKQTPMDICRRARARTHAHHTGTQACLCARASPTRTRTRTQAQARGSARAML